MLTIKIDNKAYECTKGTLLIDLIKKVFPENFREIFACIEKGTVYELSYSLDKDHNFSTLTFQDEEGRRIYERSLRFVLLIALNRLFPGKNMRILNSIGYGISGRLIDHVLTRQDILNIETEMKDIIEKDYLFERNVWSKEEAVTYFSSKNQKDKMSLLKYRPYEYFPMYSCAGVYEYFYGAMAPSTSWVDVFHIKPLFPGWILQLPDPENPSLPSQFIQRPKFQSVFAESQRWCNILNAENTTDINRLIAKKQISKFIRVNEALQDRAVADVADAIIHKRSRIVMVSGPSSSGKTTFTNRLAINLEVLGLKPVLVSLDDFYRDRKDIPFDASGEQDLEHIETLDIPFFTDLLEKLISGEEVGMPKFNFKTGKREAKLAPLKIKPGQPILVEGIHGLNPMLSEEFTDDMLYRIYVSALTCINLDNHNRIRTTDVRLLRRVVRDYKFRNTSPEKTLSMWDSVRAGEEKWIFPYQELADVMINTTLHYEIPVLKAIAYKMLKDIKPDTPQYLLSRRLLKILHYYTPMPETAFKEIPPLSILREFIGGSTFYMKPDEK